MAGAAGATAVKPHGTPDRPAVTVVQNDFPAEIGEVEIASAVEADVGFDDNVARLFSGYAFREDEIPPLNLER